jgi:H+/Cl- antiporter ClcA
MADPGSAPEEISAAQADAMIASKPFMGLLIIVAVLGLILSIAAWLFLEGAFQLQKELFAHLPHALGYQNGAPNWWYLLVLAVGALLVALALLLPGRDTHIPARGLSADPTPPINLPGILLASFGTIAFGMVLGPEVPLIALGSGLAVMLIKLARRDTPPQALMVIAATGAFTTLSFIFNSPLIAAVIMIEAAGLGGPLTRVILVPGLLAAGIGSLVSIGIGKITGLSSAAYAIGPLPLHALGRPTVAEFAWTIGLAIVVAVLTRLVLQGGMFTYRFVSRRQMLALLPLIGLIIAGLAIAFSEISGKSINNVLFDGQDQLPGLVSQAGAWSLGTVALLIVCKGLAYGLSLGSFRGGPTFPAMFLGAAGGIMASHLAGFEESAAVAVGIGTTVACVLRLPLTGVVVATLLCTQGAGVGVEPLIVVGVVVAYVTTLLLSRPAKGSSMAEPERTPPPPSTPGPEPEPEPVGVA